MLKPITHCNARLTLGIAFSVNIGVGPAAEPKVSVCSMPNSCGSRGAALGVERRACGARPLEKERERGALWGARGAP